MGSLSSRPAIPTPQPVVTQQRPVAITNRPVLEAVDDVNSDTEKAQSSARAQNLLRRGRGRFGTVLTGFRGLLGLANTNNQKRTLLGE